MSSRKVHCSKCNKEMWNTHLGRHLKTFGAQKCPVCCKRIQTNLQEHIDQCSIRSYKCSKCRESFNTGCRRTAHEKKCSLGGIKNERSALGGLFQIIELEPRLKSSDFESVLLNEINHIANIVREKRGNGINFYMGLELLMEHVGDTKIATFQTSNTLILQSTDIEEVIRQHTNAIVSDIEEYQRKGSGWVSKSVEKITLMITKYNPF